MKLEPLTILDRRNKTTSKKFDVNVIFLIYDQYEATFYLTRSESRTKKALRILTVKAQRPMKPERLRKV